MSEIIQKLINMSLSEQICMAICGLVIIYAAIKSIYLMIALKKMKNKFQADFGEDITD